jgi:ABC-type multidrug transport system ATPase subunit
MLFDEPHTGLDQDACDMLDKVLRDVAARGRTVVMTSHDLGRVEDLATRYDVLSKGVITASSNKSEFKTGNNILTFYKHALAGQNG